MESYTLSLSIPHLTVSAVELDVVSSYETEHVGPRKVSEIKLDF